VIEECLERTVALSVFDVPEPVFLAPGARASWLLG
jgi:hypothetical protein